MIYEFDKLEDLYTLSYDMSKEEIYITVNPNYHIEGNYTLKNFRTSNGGFDFDLYIGNILAEEDVTFYNPALVTNSVPGIPCPFCALIAAAADNINKFIGAVREHRRLSTCEIAMQACIDQGGVPTVTVTENGGCTVTKCLKDGSE